MIEKKNNVEGDFDRRTAWFTGLVWRQPAFRGFPWVCSSTEYYGLVLDRNNQNDLEKVEYD